eukprot:13042232-Alexandrium_andersonii.AAC.1
MAAKSAAPGFRRLSLWLPRRVRVACWQASRARVGSVPALAGVAAVGGAPARPCLLGALARRRVRRAGGAVASPATSVSR